MDGKDVWWYVVVQCVVTECLVFAFLGLLAVKAVGPGSRALPSQGQDREVETHGVVSALPQAHTVSQILNSTEH